MDLEASKKKVAALTEPRNVVLVGASERPASWAARVWQNLQRHGFPGPVYPIHPPRRRFSAHCYPDLAALPEPPDHLVVLVPAAGVPVARGGAAGARSATVFSAGFGEASDAEGDELGRALRALIAETGLAVSGPNCMGNICARSRLVTMSDTRGDAHAGPWRWWGRAAG